MEVFKLKLFFVSLILLFILSACGKEEENKEAQPFSDYNQTMSNLPGFEATFKDQPDGVFITWNAHFPEEVKEKNWEVILFVNNEETTNLTERKQYKLIHLPPGDNEIVLRLQLKDNPEFFLTQSKEITIR